MSTREFIVDFVARGEAPDEWRIVLVEEGPWLGEVDEHLRRLQTRLYDCIDATLDGQLALKFPDSRGAKLVVQLDGYNLPATEVSEFMARFSAGALESGDYPRLLANNPYIRSIAFVVNLESLPAR